MNENIDQAELKRIAKVKQRSALIEWLRNSNIQFGYTGGGEKKGEVWTTQKSLHDSLAANQSEKSRLSDIDQAVLTFPSYLFTPDEILKTANSYPLDVDISNGVYFLIVAERIVYVGRSKYINERLSQHREDKEFTHVSYIEIDRDTDTRCVESYYINKFTPELNLHYPILDSEFEGFL